MRELAAEVPPSDISADEARRTADQVLSGRAYLEAARPPSLRERLFDWIGDRIADAFGALSSFGGRGLAAYIIIGLFTLAIVFLLARLVRNMGPTPLREARRKPSIAIEGDLSPAEWMTEAEAAEAQGNWREGLRCRHRSLVTELMERDAIHTSPGQTAGEIELTVAVTVPAAHAPMSDATDLFKDVWYGGREAGPTERDRFAQLAQNVLSAVESTDTSTIAEIMVAPS